MRRNRVGNYDVVDPVDEGAVALVRSRGRGPSGEEVLVERLDRGPFDVVDVEEFVHRVRCVSAVRHPGVPCVLDLVIGRDHVSVVSERAPRATPYALLASSLPLDAALRVILDALTALGALHAQATEVRPGEGRALMHGSLAPEAIEVGSDGGARLTRLFRAPRRGGERLALPTWAVAYAAPETLLSDGTADERADLYSIGVLLWEALSGARLFDSDAADDVLVRQLAGELPRAAAREPWAEGLVEVVTRALAVDPAKRFPSAVELAAAVRLAAHARVASASRVGAWVAPPSAPAVEAAAPAPAATTTATDAPVAFEVRDGGGDETPEVAFDLVAPAQSLGPAPAQGGAAAAIAPALRSAPPAPDYAELEDTAPSLAMRSLRARRRRTLAVGSAAAVLACVLAVLLLRPAGDEAPAGVAGVARGESPPGPPAAAGNAPGAAPRAESSGASSGVPAATAAPTAGASDAASTASSADSLLAAPSATTARPAVRRLPPRSSFEPSGI